MRVSYTTLAAAALLSVAACGTSSSEIVAPENASANAAAGAGGGVGQFGSGNRSDATATQDGVGQFGSGNAIATDTTVTTSSTTERGGIGLLGSGN